MSNFVGLKVKVIMKDNVVLEGTISFVDNELMKLQNVKTQDPRRGIVSEIILNSVNIKNLEVVTSTTNGNFFFLKKDYKNKNPLFFELNF
jgi:hypothetical protein